MYELKYLCCFPLHMGLIVVFLVNMQAGMFELPNVDPSGASELLDEVS